MSRLIQNNNGSNFIEFLYRLNFYLRTKSMIYPGYSCVVYELETIDNDDIDELKLEFLINVNADFLISADTRLCRVYYYNKYEKYSDRLNE